MGGIFGCSRAETRRPGERREWILQSESDVTVRFLCFGHCLTIRSSFRIISYLCGSASLRELFRPLAISLFISSSFRMVSYADTGCRRWQVGRVAAKGA